MNAIEEYFRAAFFAAGISLSILTVRAETVTVDAAAGATVTDEQRTGAIDVSVNTGSGSTGTVILNGANDYEGTTTLGGGTLEAPVLAPAGTASSLGSSGAFTFQGGTFHYSGTEAATFDRAVTFGASDACTLQNDGDLKLTGQWTQAAQKAFTKTGTGKLNLTKDNSFYSLTSTEGTLLLSAGTTTLGSYLYVYGPQVNASASNKSTLRITGGTLTLGKDCNIYIGQNSSSTCSSDEYWASYEQTGGTVTSKYLSLAYYGQGHVSVDISGGSFTASSVMGLCYNNNEITAYVDVMVRDAGVLEFAGTYTKYQEHATLTVKDGGTMKLDQVGRYNSTANPMTILFDGGNVVWKAEKRVFYYKALLNAPLYVGTKGVSFTGNAATQTYRYEQSLVASNTVAGMTAKGVSFATGVYQLEAANSYEGPTAIRGEAIVIPTVAGAIPSASVVKVNTYGTLALTTASPTCAGLILNGNLDIVEGQTLALGTNGVSGTGCITLYTDAARTTPAMSGTYAVLTAPIANRADLESFAQTAQNGNLGSFTVTDDGTTATLNLVVDTTTTGTPDITVEGTDASGVTVSCVGTVEEYNGKKYVKPGTTAKLSITYPADGPAFAGWRDGTTGEFFWGNDLIVTPATYTTYVAVFGPAWCWDAAAGQVSNGIWTLSATVYSGSTLTLAKVIAYPSTASELNLATPITNVEGAVFTFARIGTYLTSKCLFGADDTGKAAAAKVKTLYLGGQMTQIGRQAFYSCTALTGAVTTPATCRSIGVSAFNDCKLKKAFLRNVRAFGDSSIADNEALTTVCLSDNLKSMGEKVFNGGDTLATVTPLLPDTLEEIPRSAFFKCPLRGDLRLENAKRVCWGAFQENKFDSVTMPSVTNIGQSAFYKSPSTSYVFGKEKVTFIDETGLYGQGRMSFYSTSDTLERHFYFPGKAPELPVFWAGTHATGTNQLFGTSAQNGKVVLHGSWRNDPEGWQKIVNEIGGTDISEKGTRPALDRAAGDRSVKGYFQWYDKVNETTCWGWLVNTKMPGDEAYNTGTLLIIK